MRNKKLEENKKSVCVLMSTYNGEKFLREQIDSVLAQEGVIVNLFVRDDCSKDGTVDILKEYEAKGLLKLICGKENLGFLESFSWLIANAPKADFFALCDQDDVWLPKKLINGVQALQKENNNVPNAYFTSVIVVDENLNVINDDTYKVYEKPQKNPFAYSLLTSTVAGCTTLFNEKLRQFYARIPIEKILSHDGMISSIAACFGKLVFSKDSQILYRQHANNVCGYVKYRHGLRVRIRSMKYHHKTECKSVRYRQAELFSFLFSEELSDENKKFIWLMTNYKYDKQAYKALKVFIKENIEEKATARYLLRLLRRKCL